MTHAEPNLLARVDAVLAIHCSAEAVLQGCLHPALFLAGALAALANKPMTRGDELAWQEIQFIQNKLWAATDRCSIEFENGQSSYRCANSPTTFCGSCGAEICLDHAAKCCMETFCVGCIEFHKCPVLA